MKFINLATDIDQIVALESQIDPKFKTTRCYIRITAIAIFKRLCELKSYLASNFCLRTINNIINRLGYTLKKTLKTKPLKKIPQTDAIFANIAEVHQECKDKANVFRISIDTKATVKIGNLSRNGKSRQKKAPQACDHDQHWDAVLHPFGVSEIDTGQLSVYFGNSIATADFIVDGLEHWYDDRKTQIPDNQILMIELDNGQSNAATTRQFLNRMVEWVKKINRRIHLVYYPPYHSKYNPVERCWAAIEKYWNGCILDSVENTLKICENVIWKSKKTIVKLIDKEYVRKVIVPKEQFESIQPFIERKIDLQKWDVWINPIPSMVPY